MTIRLDLLRHKAHDAYKEGFEIGRRWHKDENAPDGKSWEEYVKSTRDNRREWFDGFFDGLFGDAEQIEKDIEKEMCEG